MKQLFQELKPRNVYRVAVAYPAAAFVVVPAARLRVGFWFVPNPRSSAGDGPSQAVH